MLETKNYYVIGYIYAVTIRNRKDTRLSKKHHGKVLTAVVQGLTSSQSMIFEEELYKLV